MIRKSYFKFAALLSMCIAVSCSDDDPGKGGGGKSEVKVPENAVDLSAAGTANCYIVKPGGTVVFDAQYKGNSTTESIGNPVTAELVWQDAKNLIQDIYYVSKEKKIVAVTAPGTSGNAVVAACGADGEILWSWHLWIADYDPAASLYTTPANASGTTWTFMDRNVGATEFDGALVGSLGVYFQWGRKDPFIGANRIQKNYTDEYEGVGFQTTGDNGFTALFLYNDALCEGFKFVNKEMDMSMSIANPTVFYGVYNSGGWKGSNSEVEDYWGGASGTKTNNDPCPAGYRVPTFDEINGFIKDIDTNKTAQENVSDQSYGRKYTVGDQTFMFPGSALRVWSAKMRYPGRVTFFWSSTISPTTEKKALDFYDYRWNTNADNTCCAMAVRCIKIQ